MTLMKKKFDYAETLGDSVKQAFSQPKIFIPIILYIIAYFVMYLFYLPKLSPLLQGVFDFNFLLWLPVLFIVGMIFSSWILIEIKQIIHNKKIRPFKDFNLHTTLKFIELYLIIWLLMVAIGLIFTLIFGLVFLIAFRSAVLSIILGVVIGSAAFAVAIIFFSWMLYVPVIMLMEKISPWQAIEKTWEFYKKQKGHCIAMMAIYIALIIVASIIGNLVLSLFIPSADAIYIMLEQPAYYTAMMIPSFFFSMIAMIWGYTYYFNAYILRKK